MRGIETLSCLCTQWRTTAHRGPCPRITRHPGGTARIRDGESDVAKLAVHEDVARERACHRARVPVTDDPTTRDGGPGSGLATDGPSVNRRHGASVSPYLRDRRQEHGQRPAHHQLPAEVDLDVRLRPQPVGGDDQDAQEGEVLRDKYDDRVQRSSPDSEVAWPCRGSARGATRAARLGTSSFNNSQLNSPPSTR